MAALIVFSLNIFEKDSLIAYTYAICPGFKNGSGTIATRKRKLRKTTKLSAGNIGRKKPGNIFRPAFILSSLFRCTFCSGLFLSFFQCRIDGLAKVFECWFSNKRLIIDEECWNIFNTPVDSLFQITPQCHQR